jgi:hypothetical protein
MSVQPEITRREAVARTAILEAYRADAEDGPALFVSHHFDELDSVYWIERFGSDRPQPQVVLKALVLQSHWSEEDEEGGVDFFDFTLPGDVTNYVISVSFDESGDVEDVVMES